MVVPSQCNRNKIWANNNKSAQINHKFIIRAKVHFEKMMDSKSFENENVNEHFFPATPESGMDVYSATQRRSENSIGITEAKVREAKSLLAWCVHNKISLW